MAPVVAVQHRGEVGDKQDQALQVIDSHALNLASEGSARPGQSADRSVDGQGRPNRTAHNDTATAILIISGPSSISKLSTIRYNFLMVDRVDETAGSLLRRARVGAGLSQAELAFRANVVQSVISAYEAGRRQPSLPTLAALIDAAGCDLVVDIQQQPPQLSRLSGPVGRQVRRKRRNLVAAAAAHDVTNLRVFGSVARGEDRPDSDVDLLVDLPSDMGLFGLGQVQAELEAILGTKVDLVPASDLKPEVRARAERELVAL
jgi:predicted nucleotidyltransferase/ribosome-binding protein aMBF1 (putative translation factor)